MKLKTYLLLSLSLGLGACAVSCNKNDDVRKEEKEPPELTEQAYLALKMNNMPTRAGGDANATVDDITVNGACILLFDAAAPYDLLYKFPLEITNLNAGGTDIEDFRNKAGVNYLATAENADVPTGESFVSKAFPVAVKSYGMVLLLNAKPALLDGLITAGETGTTTTLTTFNAARNATLNTLGTIVGAGPGYKEILMSNAQGAVNVPASSLKYSEEDAEEAPATVDVIRAFAKIKVIKGAAFSNTLADNSKIIDGTVSWQVDVTNRKTFLMRQTAAADYASENAEQANWYARDPNFEIASLSETFLESEFNYATAPFPASGSDAGTAFVASPGNFRFVLENTMSAAEQTAALLAKGATRVTLCARITPDGYDPATDYYSYNGFTFTQAQAREWTASAGWPADLAGIEAAIDAVNTKYMMTMLDFTQLTEPIFYFSVNGLTFHKDQWNVYNIPIRHFDLAEGTLGYYGVVRSNIYEVTINSIKGPGPPPGDETYVSANVRLLPWAFRTQVENEVVGE